MLHVNKYVYLLLNVWFIIFFC